MTAPAALIPFPPTALSAITSYYPNAVETG
jgi:hypothetical protein